MLLGGSDTEHRDKKGLTALHNATNKGHSSIVELLINTGAKVDVRTDYGNTPLMVAAGYYLGQEQKQRYSKIPLVIQP